jgi:hypothetical protein
LSALNELNRKDFTIGPSPHCAPALADFGVNPCYPVDYQKSAHIVAHRVTALDNSALISRPSFFSTPGHLDLNHRACRGFAVIAGNVVSVLFFGIDIRSMCK